MIFSLVIFIAAFLLFQVQPLIAKIILPYFGGGSAVWTACLLFFQAFLLLGYLYAHLLSKIKSFKTQLILHGSLLVLSLLVMPIGISSIESLETTQMPLLSILTLLTGAIGLPYFLLSSTGPLVQFWYTVANKGSVPYKLYSLSNFASLLALLSFPFIIEPLLTSQQQSQVWSFTYFLYVCSLLVLAYKLFSSKHTFNITTHKADLISAKDKTTSTVQASDKDRAALYWLGFSMLGVVLLVSTTNAMTQNIPPVPFLWILPLCLYLLTFIISFHSTKWYVRWYWFSLFVLTAFIGLFMFYIGSQFDITSQVLLYSSILFSACMICHGELARLKPEANKLTSFYLTISFGGFLGSLLVAFVAPQIFTQFFEFPLALIVLLCLFGFGVVQEQKKLDKLSFMSLSSAVICSVLLWQLNSLYVKTDIYSERNFYGILSVKDVEINGEKERRLIDGTTSHGSQSLDLERKNIPLSYYRKDTGVAIAIEQLRAERKLKHESFKVGFIGLGAGTLAAYGESTDIYRFYELNPAVVNAANQYFSYLHDSKASIEIIAGDGRVSLQKEYDNSQVANFDLLVIDAFSGDSIPQHLLTTEAMALYWQHVKNDGVITIHVSNTHLNLLPLMAGISESTDKALVYFRTKAKNSADTDHDTQWVWLTNNQTLLNNAVTKVFRSPLPEKQQAKVLWTDDFSHLLSVLK